MKRNTPGTWPDCLAVVVVIAVVGGSGAVSAAAAVGAASVLPQSRVGAASAAAAALGLAIAAPFGEQWLPITLTANKRSSGPVAHSEWDAFSKIDLLAREADLDAGRPASRTFRIDGGTAFTGVVDPAPWLEKLDSKEPIGSIPM